MLSYGRLVQFVCLGTLLNFILPTRAYSLETDNYFAWGKQLEDSHQVANQTMNQILEEWTAKANRSKGPLNCMQFSKGLHDEFKAIRDRTDANWDPFRAEMLPQKNTDLPDFFKRDSIYRELFNNFKSRFTHLAGTIQINDVTMGVDKIAHFVLIGHEYYQVYQNSLRKKNSPNQALASALKHGIETEMGKLGLWYIAFSYGDLEANYQGLRFYNELCAGENPFMEWSGTRWIRTTREFDWADYISGYMDESFNANGHDESKWIEIMPFVKNYCPLLQDPSVITQRKYYDNNFQKSDSQLFMEEQERLDKTPIRRSIQNVCEIH